MSSRLEALRKKKREAQSQNKQELYKDFQNQKLKSVNLKALARGKEGAEDKLEQINKGDDYTRAKNWGWSVEECEAWEAKQNERAAAKNRSETHDYGKLAEQVYTKEISKLQVDKEEYSKARAKNSAGTSNTAYLVQKPSKNKISSLAQGIQETSAKRAALSKRKTTDNSNSEGYINEKNRQFNMKLDRQYK
ncbi:pre-mRNA-splicing factor Syf2p [[Candida] anglica]|uniref:Pre-mRNA-splicing factor SYF2 n=1 Tax=[Candida] anglica TaxID=148631 RepID=A0ABP0EDR6_9ASCO